VENFESFEVCINSKSRISFLARNPTLPIKDNVGIEQNIHPLYENTAGKNDVKGRVKISYSAILNQYLLKSVQGVPRISDDHFVYYFKVILKKYISSLVAKRPTKGGNGAIF
jgi:hypothetical protein